MLVVSELRMQHIAHSQVHHVHSDMKQASPLAKPNRTHGLSQHMLHRIPLLVEVHWLVLQLDAFGLDLGLDTVMLAADQAVPRQASRATTSTSNSPTETIRLRGCAIRRQRGGDLVTVGDVFAVLRHRSLDGRACYGCCIGVWRSRREGGRHWAVVNTAAVEVTGVGSCEVRGGRD